MARAITQISRYQVNPEEEQARAQEEIMKALTDNKDAVLNLITLVKRLDDLKVFQAANAFIEKGEDIGVIAMQQINQPTMHNVIKNAMGAFTFLGSIQPAQLNTIMEGLSHGMKEMSRTGEKGEKQSVWRLRLRFWTPEIRAAMTTMMSFMQGMGEVFLRNRREN
ncbi:DUF1641 domain-containing protein [Neobacillus terrae]|uniref:DUF1641 domain-containing protein n=1 Tax=Neobacillus terrae TaxID=3034837 RepID=UPI0014091AC1|nr:DUF1641 domain-containing protein [Neobacillus terrae]NHM31170.1 DUF1641 domain-containing protein [Neobacillus terrae]